MFNNKNKKYEQDLRLSNRRKQMLVYFICDLPFTYTLDLTWVGCIRHIFAGIMQKCKRIYYLLLSSLRVLVYDINFWNTDKKTTTLAWSLFGFLLIHILCLDSYNFACHLE